MFASLVCPATPRMETRQDQLWRKTRNVLHRTAERKEDIRQATTTACKHSSILRHVYLLSHKYIDLSSTQKTEFARLLEVLQVTQLPKQLWGAENCQSKVPKAPTHWVMHQWWQEVLQSLTRLAHSGAAKWGLKEEVKKFELLFSRRTKPRNPTAVSDQHQRRFSWPIL